MLAVLPLIPIVLAVLALGVVGTALAVRGAPGKGGAITLKGLVSPRTGLAVKRSLMVRQLKRPVPGRMIPGVILTAKVKRFLEDSEPMLLESKGGKTWKWGFCVKDVIDSATRAGGANATAKVIEWIQNWTGLSVITMWLCFRFEFKLYRFEDPTGKNHYPYQEPPLPLNRYYTPEFWAEVRKQHPTEYSGLLVTQKKFRVVVQRVDMGDVREAWFAYFIDDGTVWLLSTTGDIRRALREDKLNISDVGSAQYKPGRWRFSTRKKAMAVFK